MTKRLGWTLIPMLALAAVTVTATAADDPAQAWAKDGAASGSSATSTDRTAPGVPRRVGAGGTRAATAASRPGTAAIVGAVSNADSTPAKGADLRLRNVVTGKIAAVTKANEAGQFTFEHVDAGSYVVELVTDSGHVQTMSDVVTIAPGETVATIVRVGPKIPWIRAFFSNTAGAVATTAAAEGIAAIAPTGLCQSPPCH
ncbi:MAG TPA: carboxypeptidase-like regulatory domain-containing protein [Vicinamibacterales bacterium]